MSIDTNQFIKNYDYTWTIRNLFGFNNHFQGITVNKNEDQLFLSGADFKMLRGDIFVSNKYAQNRFEIVEKIKTLGDFRHWHAGGIAFYDDYLVVPVETTYGKKSSEVYFYKSEKNNLNLVDIKIVLSDQKAGAVDIVFDEDLQKYLLFVFTNKQIAIYRSKSEIVEDGFEFYKKINQKFYSGSNSKVIRQCDGKYYFFDVSGNFLVSRIFRKKDSIKVYLANQNFSKLNYRFKKKFKCNGKCLFRGASNLIEKDGKLSVISSKMYKERDKDLIYLTKFSQSSD